VCQSRECDICQSGEHRRSIERYRLLRLAMPRNDGGIPNCTTPRRDHDSKPHYKGLLSHDFDSLSTVNSGKADEDIPVETI
jgi:hypothetical protein